MIKTFLIKNYRLFKELKIERLSRVNLFVGKNNSGKSCLLEALQIYATKAVSSVLAGIVANREEDWNDTPPPIKNQKIQQIDSPYRFLFHGYRFPQNEADAIEIGIDNNNNEHNLRIMPRFYEIAKDKAGRMIEIEMGLELLEGNENRFLTHLFNINHEKNILAPAANTKIQIVPPQGISNDTLEKLWDNINITDLEDEVIKCLQLVDHNVQKIAFVGGGQTQEGGKKRIPIVRYANTEERIPLKTLGDGITRLFHIALSLVNAKDGYLLIDEFENGLHWSIQPGLWNIIFILAERLNVQVFATTHNRDCIRGFYQAWEKREKYGTFYRLDSSKKNKIKTIHYTCEILGDALETGVEVR